MLSDVVDPLRPPLPLVLQQAWRAAMPRVVPYYAVKCYPEPAILRLLAGLGAGFDCASKGEVGGRARAAVAASVRAVASFWACMRGVQACALS